MPYICARHPASQVRSLATALPKSPLSHSGVFAGKAMEKHAEWLIMKLQIAISSQLNGAPD